jgi:predicted dehydrogenase
MTGLRWGLIGASTIAAEHMIDSFRANGGEAVAVMSASADRAARYAAKHNIAKSTTEINALVEDKDIDAVYISTTNELHCDQVFAAAAAGKHVLCEKPIATNGDEARRLIAARDRAGVTICEATMVRLHPRWLAVRDLLRADRIGELRAFVGTFGYSLPSRDNIRYDAAMGGGVLLDTAFYPVTVSRFCFEAEPTAVTARAARDPQTGVDLLTSGVLEFPRGHATFTCCMEIAPMQRAVLLGARGHLDVPTAWNPPPELPSEVIVETSLALEQPTAERLTFPPVDQYARLVEAFVRAAASGDRAGPIPLEDSLKNQTVLDALARSAASGRCEPIAV